VIGINLNLSVLARDAGAIYVEPELSEDDGIENIDHHKCAGPFSKQFGNRNTGGESRPALKISR